MTAVRLHVWGSHAAGEWFRASPPPAMVVWFRAGAGHAIDEPCNEAIDVSIINGASSTKCIRGWLVYSYPKSTYPLSRAIASSVRSLCSHIYRSCRSSFGWAPSDSPGFPGYLWRSCQFSNIHHWIWSFERQSRKFEMA